MDVARANIFDLNWRLGGYRSTFYNSLTLSERLAFCEERNSTVWIGPDATIESFDPFNARNMTFTVFRTCGYISSLSELT